MLFVAKGCLTCHVHGGVDMVGSMKVGPELTHLRFPADYLAKFLADPTIKPPTVQYARMPNLELTRADIAALVAFVNAESKVAARKE